MSGLIAFLGPSLPAAEARAIAGSVTLRPPAARGDVWRALRARPRAIALVDGVFEGRPSVWHREILEVLAAGVAVFGGASMGALRACELGPFGMVGVGRIFRWYRDGEIVDDAEVALLHADGSHAYRPLTVPLVNVRWVAERALAARVLRRAEARALVSAAVATFYQERRWPALLGRVRWSPGARRRFERFAAEGLPDLKAEDARACLAAAAGFVRARARPASVRWRPPPVRARLGEKEPRLPQAGDAAALAAWARQLGHEVDDRQRASARAAYAGHRGWSVARFDAELRAAGLNAAEAARFVEDLALAELVRARGPACL